MKNLIIVVGADGSGKTTIVQKLNEVLGYKTKHFSVPKSYEDAKESYYNFLETKESYILDRFYEGEMIFAPIYRGYDGSDYFNDLETKITEEFDNVLLVYLKPSFETIVQRIEERGEEFVKPEHYRYCYDKVDEFYNRSILNKIKLRTDLLTPESIKEIVLEYFFFG